MLNLLLVELLFVEVANRKILLDTSIFSEGVGTCCRLLNPHAASVCWVCSKCVWWFHINVNTAFLKGSPIKYDPTSTVFDEQHSQ